MWDAGHTVNLRQDWAENIDTLTAEYRSLAQVEDAETSTEVDHVPPALASQDSVAFLSTQRNEVWENDAEGGPSGQPGGADNAADMDMDDRPHQRIRSFPAVSPEVSIPVLGPSVESETGDRYFEDPNIETLNIVRSSCDEPMQRSQLTPDYSEMRGVFTLADDSDPFREDNTILRDSIAATSKDCMQPHSVSNSPSSTASGPSRRTLLSPLVTPDYRLAEGENSTNENPWRKDSVIADEDEDSPFNGLRPPMLQTSHGRSAALVVDRRLAIPVANMSTFEGQAASDETPILTPPSYPQIQDGRAKTSRPGDGKRPDLPVSLKLASNEEGKEIVEEQEVVEELEVPTPSRRGSDQGVFELHRDQQEVSEEDRPKKIPSPKDRGDHLVYGKKARKSVARVGAKRASDDTPEPTIKRPRAAGYTMQNPIELDNE